PGAQLDLHGRLGPLGAAGGLGGARAAELLAVDVEDHVVGRPVDGVAVQALHGVEADGVGLAVDVLVDALGEEVGLDVSGLATDPFLMSKVIQVSYKKTYMKNCLARYNQLTQ